VKPRLRLIKPTVTPAPRKRRKRNFVDPRKALLRMLREQRRKIDGWSYFKRDDAPDLFELALAADRAPAGRRTVMFRGVRFPLRHGYRAYVLDPRTGRILIGGRLP
jgi:hypothetical protein